MTNISIQDQNTSAPGQGAGLIPVDAPIIPTGANIETVGVGEEFSTISAAIAASTDGTVILVNAGTYTNDFATIYNKITIEGVGGMVNLVATEPPANLKGIITVDNDATIENVSFSGSSIPDADGGNGAGIRYEGGQLNLVNDSFSNNEDGILAYAVIPSIATNTVTANHCLFQNNGSGSGYTHNIYVGDIQSFTLENSISEGAVVGHEVKSRAETNLITNNVIEDGPTGTSSYEIDLPNGGNDTVTNNLIEKGPGSQNNAMVHFGGEGIPYAASSLSLSGNDFVNDLGPQAVATLNQTAISANINDNIFNNIAFGQIVQGPATGTGNVDGTGNPLPPINAVGVLPGNTLFILAADSNAHDVTLNGNYGAIQDLGTGLLTVDDEAGHVLVIGGSGGLDLTEQPGTGGSSYTTAPGSTNVLTLVGQDLVDSQGNDTINTGGSNLTMQVGGKATINDGAGSNQIAITGTAIVDENNSDSFYSVAPSASLSISGNDTYAQIQNDAGTVNLAIVQDGAALSLSIVGGAEQLAIYGGAVHLTTAASIQGGTIHLGAGTASVTSAGSDTIYAGSGNDTIIVESNATIYAGPGTLSVFGRGYSGATVYGDGGDITLNGDSGGITYVGGASSSTVDCLLSSNTFIGGAGHLTIDGGSRETINGGRGGITFNAEQAGNGANQITTAAGARDLLTLTDADSITSRGDDLIKAGAGSQSITVLGNALIENGTGNNSITVAGRAIIHDAGQDFVTVQSGGQAAVSAGSLAMINETGGLAGLTVAGPNAGSALVSGGQASLVGGTTQAVNVTTGTADTTLVTLRSGAVTINSNGSDTIEAVSGNDTINQHGSATITGGAAHLAVNEYTSAVSDTLTFIGGTGKAALALGAGAADITFGTGDTTVLGSGFGGADIYRFVAGQGGGIDIINNFRTGVDQLAFQGVSIASSTVVNGSTDIILSDNTKLELVNVTSTR